jgi:UDP-glucose 4-epimerase
MKGNRVLVTGGLGFIGSNLARRCLERGAKVTVYDNLDSRAAGNAYNVHDIRSELKLVSKDIRDFEDVCEAVRNQDLIFNCAAFSSHPMSMREPLIDIDVNCKGLLNLLEATRQINADAKLVQIGTSTQIGKMLYSPIDENHPEFPVDIYSANKVAAEKYTLIYASGFGLRTTVVRLANVFGPRSRISNPDFGFMNYFIGLALQGKDLTVYGDGGQVRNISYVEDCVDALMLVAQSERSDGQVFFATADRQYSVAEIAESIAANIGGKVRFVPWPEDRKAIDVGDAVISNSKIKERLDWKPQHSLTDGLILTRDYFRDRLREYLG